MLPGHDCEGGFRNSVSLPLSHRAGFTIVELVVVILLLGALSAVAVARFVRPSAFVPSVVTGALVQEARLAQQLATSRADASVSLIVDQVGSDWRFRISNTVDGVTRTELVGADNSALQVSSGAATGAVSTASPLTVTYDGAGDLAAVMIGAVAGDPATGVAIDLAGDSSRSICIYPSGYATDDACR